MDYWEELKEPLYKFIVENRSMYRDDGVDKGQGDIIDFINATVTKTGRKITVDAHGWGGWPLYDYIVDDDWADTGLAEGTVINTYTGTKIYSTIQGAVDAWQTSAVDKSIFICPGHYDEDVVVQTATAGDTVQRLSMEGGAGCTAFIDGSITFDGLFNNPLSQEYRPPSVIRNLKVSVNTAGGKGAGDLIFGQNVVHDTNAIEGLSFENCHFEGTVKPISAGTDHAVQVLRCSFLNCTFGAGMDDNGFVLLLEECHFEGCAFQGAVDISKASGATTSGIGLALSSNPTTFTECLFLKGLRAGDILAGVFSACSFQNAASTAYCVWISGGDNIYGAQVGEAIFTGCHFMYENGANAEFGFITLGSTQTIGTAWWENFIVSNCTFDVPTAPTSGTNPIHAVWWLGNLVADIPKILFANNTLIEDSDGNRLEDVATTPASTTIEGAFRDSVFGPCEPPNFDVDLATGSANNLYIGTGNVIGAGASSVTIIGGGSSGSTSGILYDSAALTLGYRAFLCRFDATIVTVAAGTLALTNNATNYVEVNAAGTVSANTTAHTLGHIPLGTVVTLGSDITTITEQSATLDESATNIFTAQSVLAATTAHTPAALTVTEQTVVGRLTGGNIAAVSMGIADNNVVQIDQADVADNDFAKFTAAGLEGRSYAEVKQDLDLEDADIKALAVTGVEAEATLDLTGDVTVAAAKTLALDHVIEKTAGHGIVLDGVELKDDAVETDAIRGLRETSGPTALTVGTITDGEFLKRVGATIVSAAAAGGGAPTDADYLVGTANAGLSAEIVVGATPGGELGGTWASPTVDATHSGSAHHAAVTVAADLSPLVTLSTQELSFAVQNANKVLAGPTSGGDADPTMRALVAADIPSLTAYVPKTLYDAQSILAATADDTPAAVTVAEQRLVGRLTGGNIDDITIGIADDNILQVDQASTADDNDYAKFTANGIEGRSYAEVISDLGLKTVATDTIWAAAGDLAVATGNDAAGVLTKGTDGKVLTMVAGAVAWAAAAGGGGVSDAAFSF